MTATKPNLKEHPPRSPRVRLGGYAGLARALDKGRATALGVNGEYHFDCPMDQRVFSFIGIDAAPLLEQLKQGKSDGEILAWIEKNARTPRTAIEIALWSAAQETRAPSDVESRAFFNELHQKSAPAREDISSWFDLLDVDDYVSFGGKA